MRSLSLLLWIRQAVENCVEFGASPVVLTTFTPRSLLELFV